MVLEVHTVTKMRVQQVAEREITLQGLHKIEPGAAADAVEQVIDGRHHVEGDKKQRQGTRGCGHVNKLYLFRTGILELNCKDGKVMLRCKRTKHRQVAASGWIVARYFVIKNSDAHANFPLEPFHFWCKQSNRSRRGFSSRKDALR
jgi:hypothetical protein